MIRSCFLSLPAVAQTRDVCTILITATLTTAQTSAEVERTSGGVEVVPDTASKTTPVQTIKDMLQYVPGVIVQSRVGDDFFEVDPSAYAYVEVFENANALRYGANTLGGAGNLARLGRRDAAPLDARLDYRRHG